MKSVYFKARGLTQDQLEELFTIMVAAGGEVCEKPKYRGKWKYYGVDEKGATAFFGKPDNYVGGVEVEPTPEALREALGILSESTDIERYIDQDGFFMFQNTEVNYDWVVGVKPKITPLLHYKNEAHKFQHLSRCIEGSGVTRSKAIRAAINKVRSVGRPVHKDVFWPKFE